MKNIFVTICIFLIVLSLSCKKKGKEKEVIVLTDTLRQYFPLDTALKKNYNFKMGSYWIFTNGSCSMVTTDSLYLSNRFEKYDTVKLVTENTVTLKLYETIGYTYMKSSGCGSSIYWKMRGNSIPMTPHITASYPNFTPKDSISLANGKVYHSVLNYSATVTYYQQSWPTPIYDFINVTLRPHRGFIYFQDMYQSKYELLRYHIEE